MQGCEDRLRDLTGREAVLLASRATLALVAALRALCLPRGSEVLLPVTLCANPALAVRLAGLRPLFADIDPDAFSISLSEAEQLVSPATRVLLAVPLFGHALDCQPLLDFAHRHSLIVIEDAAHAVGLRHSDRPAGSLGLCSIYSFGPGKIADAGGGAAVLSGDPSFMEQVGREIDLLSRSGMAPANRERIGDALAGLENELKMRGRLAGEYRSLLSAANLVHPPGPSGSPLWKYSVLASTREERDRITRSLIHTGIEAANLYPPLAPYFPETRNSKAVFLGASDLFSRIINLPLWPQTPGMAEKAAVVVHKGRGSGIRDRGSVEASRIL